VAELVRRAGHLVARFLGSLVPREPPDTALARVRAVLTPSELALWEAMPRADRVESIRTLERLPADVAADERWAAAALLHDAGKQASGLGTFRRAAVTARAAAFGGRRVRGRGATYLQHPAVGARMLEAAGARREAVAWAATHHDPPHWPVALIPPDVCAALARADGEPAPTRTPPVK
jgi:hypothetical protein